MEAETNISADENHQQPAEEELIAFGAGLQKELDQIGYPPAPERAKKLSGLLGVTRAQVFKMFRGVNFPSHSAVFKLAKLGVSFDRILSTGHTQETATQLRIDGNVVSVILKKSKPKTHTNLVAIRGEDGILELKFRSNLEEIPPDAFGIHCLKVPGKPSLAIVEDDPGTLTGLTDILSESFFVTACASKSDLLSELKNGTNFDAFLVDWKLPNVTGDELVRAIRGKSPAPLFILTGATEADELVAKALDHPNTHHASKPVLPVVLIKRIETALLKT